MSQLTGQSRKAIKLAESLHRELAAYALAAGAAGVSALALAQPADAQIIYTPTNKVINTGEKLSIDFKHDGVADVIIREGRCSVSTFFPGNSLQAVPQHAGGGIERHYRGLAAALYAGSKIGGQNSFNSNAAVMATFTNYDVYYFGSWGNDEGAARYLGIRFTSAGEIHYGWARLTVSPANKDIVANLTGYAYEAQPNTPIHAGDTGKNDVGMTGEALPSSESSARPLRSLGNLAAGAPSLPRCGWTQ